MNTSNNPYNNKGYILWLIGLIVLAAILRFYFVARIEVSEFDPWRHLVLIDNIHNGRGFSLFDRQPYIWYNGIWYHLAALTGPAHNAAWLSVSLSLVSMAVFILFLLRTEHSFAIAFAGGLMMAAYGPLLTFTSGYGSESFALFLALLSCLLATYQQKRMVILVAGVLFGIALMSRIHFMFTCFLLLPLLPGIMNRVLFLSTVATILLIGWWHNHTIINSYPYLFSWDGLATKSSDYSIISTLVPQLHPAVVSATRTLHEQVAPMPFDFFSRGPAAWGNIVFLFLGIFCVLATKRLWLIIATLVPLVYFNLFDSTLSSNFFRIYLAVFPQLFIGIAVICGRLHFNLRNQKGIVTFIWPVVPVLVILSGIPYLTPYQVPELEAVVPPQELLSKEFYMVNSGFYHPESLIRRYPEKTFIGMPLNPAQFDEFSRHYPRYTTIIWHQEFSVQDPLFHYLTNSGKYQIVTTATNTAGMLYYLLEKAAER